MWDIYGQPLKKGHCEVHPGRPLEYPCDLCFEEQSRREKTEENFIVEKRLNNLENRLRALEEAQAANDDDEKDEGYF